MLAVDPYDAHSSFAAKHTHTHAESTGMSLELQTLFQDLDLSWNATFPNGENSPKMGPKILYSFDGITCQVSMVFTQVTPHHTLQI